MHAGVEAALVAVDALGDRAGDEVDRRARARCARAQLKGRAVERLGAGGGLLGRAEHGPLLRQDDELGARGGGRAHEPVGRREVALAVRRGVQLDGCDAHGFLSSPRIDPSVNPRREHTVRLCDSAVQPWRRVDGAPRAARRPVCRRRGCRCGAAGRPLKRWRWVGASADDLMLCAAIAHDRAAAGLAGGRCGTATSGALAERTVRRRGGDRARRRAACIDDGRCMDAARRRGRGVEIVSPHGAAVHLDAQAAAACACAAERRCGRRLDGRRAPDSSTTRPATTRATPPGAGRRGSARPRTAAPSPGTSSPACTTAPSRPSGPSGSTASRTRSGRSGSTISSASHPPTARARVHREAARAHRERAAGRLPDYEQPFGAFTGELPGAGDAARGLGRDGAPRRPLVTTMPPETSPRGEAGVGPAPRPARRPARPGAARGRRPRNVVDRYRFWRTRRSSPTSTPAGTRSTSPSRTGSTTSTSAPSSATPTRSSPPRSTSSASASGTAAARWSPTATSTSATTRRSRSSPPGRRPSAARPRHRQPARLAADRRATRCPRAARCCSARRARASRDEARELSRGRARHPPVRLHPVDQRRGRLGVAMHEWIRRHAPQRGATSSD